MDGDDLMDLVAFSSSTMVVWEGKPFPDYFGTPVSIPLSGSPKWLDFGDLDGDGVDDAAVALNGGPSGLAILRGSATNGLSSPTYFAIGGHPTWLGLADIENDGNLDVVAFMNDSACVVSGDGIGGFQSIQSYRVAAQPTRGALADFNGDGSVDIAASSNLDVVTVLASSSFGGFGVGVDYLFTDVGDLVVLDANIDGLADFGVANPSGQCVEIMINLGTGSFTPGFQIPLPVQPSRLRLLDVSGDAIEDLVAISGPKFAILEGSGAGTFSGGEVYDLGMAASFFADLSGDGLADVFAAATNGLIMNLGTSPGHFQGYETEPFVGVKVLTLEDLNFGCRFHST